MSTNRLAFLTPHIAPNHLSLRLIHNINQYYETPRADAADIVVFFETAYHSYYRPFFTISNIVDAWNYTGSIVTTNLDTTQKVIRFPHAARKFFYAWDLEWIAVPATDRYYEVLADIYQSDRIELIAPSEIYKNVIEKVWGRPVKAVIENFNIHDFIKLIK